MDRLRNRRVFAGTAATLYMLSAISFVVAWRQETVEQPMIIQSSPSLPDEGMIVFGSGVRQKVDRSTWIARNWFNFFRGDSLAAQQQRIIVEEYVEETYSANDDIGAERVLPRVGHKKP